MKTISTLLLALFIHTSLFSQISSLTSSVKNNRIDLTWSASAEKNVSHYLIEKSIDGKQFDQAGIVFTYETAATDVMYPFFEKIANNNAVRIVYYRVSTVNNNGSIGGIQTITVNLNQNLNNAVGAIKKTSPANTLALSERRS